MSAPGTPLPSFADFVKATNNRLLTGPEEILNEAAKQAYGMFSDMLFGRGSEETFQSGARIIDRVQLSAGAGFSFYQPNQQFSPAITDTLTNLTFDWRFAKDYFAWTDQEILLNQGEPAKIMYKRLKKAKEQAAITSTMNGMEEALWNAPDADTMEAQTGTKPYSLRCFVTEAGGLPLTADGVTGTAWSTIAGVSPTTESKCNNKTATYVTANIDTQLLPAFDAMFLKLQWIAPQRAQEYFEETRWKKIKICSDLNGVKKYTALTRDYNDRMVPATDPGFVAASCVYNGIPVRYIPGMDAIGYTSTKPRFFWFNLDYIYPVFHSQKYLKQEDPVNLAAVGQPESWVVYTLTWYNLVIRSRQRQGIVLSSD